MTLSELYERAARQGIEIDILMMRELRAVSFPEGWIAIDRSRYHDDIEFKCDLAHEIGHCETGAFYNIYSLFDLKSKCERKANKRAVEILMPLDEVRHAMRKGYRTAWALAEWFEVTQSFAEMALAIYEGDLIHDSEQAQLAMVLAHAKVANGYKPLPPMMKARDLKPKPRFHEYVDWKDDVLLRLNYMED